MLLSALHQGPSPQPPAFLPPHMQRISPLPLPAFHHPTMPIFQGSGLVSILSNSGAALPPPGSISPELLARASSSANSLSPASQSSVSPLAALRHSPLGGVHPDLLRYPVPHEVAAAPAGALPGIPNHRATDLHHPLAEHYRRNADLLNSHAATAYKSEAGSVHLVNEPPQNIKQESLVMPPPPVRLETIHPHQVYHKELLDAYNRNRDNAVAISREEAIRKQTEHDSKPSGYPATGALAQLIKMNPNQMRLPMTSTNTNTAVDRVSRTESPPSRPLSSGKPRAYIINQSAQSIPPSGKPRAHHVTHQSQGGGKLLSHHVAQNQAGHVSGKPRAQLSQGHVVAGKPHAHLARQGGGGLSGKPRSHIVIQTSAAHPAASGAAPHTSTTTPSVITVSVPAQSSTNPATGALQPGGSVNRSQHPVSITTTTTLHSGSIQSLAHVAQASSQRQHPHIKVVEASHPKSFIAQKPSSFVQAGGVQIVRIPTVTGGGAVPNGGSAAHAGPPSASRGSLVTTVANPLADSHSNRVNPTKIAQKPVVHSSIPTNATSLSQHVINQTSAHTTSSQKQQATLSTHAQSGNHSAHAPHSVVTTHGLIGDGIGHVAQEETIVNGEAESPRDSERVSVK